MKPVSHVDLKHFPCVSHFFPISKSKFCAWGSFVILDIPCRERNSPVIGPKYLHIALYNARLSHTHEILLLNIKTWKHQKDDV